MIDKIIKHIKNIKEIFYKALINLETTLEWWLASRRPSEHIETQPLAKDEILTDAQNDPKYNCSYCDIPMVYVKCKHCEDMGLYAFDAQCDCYESRDIAIPKDELKKDGK